MSDPVIRDAAESDLMAVEAALKALAQDLTDPYRPGRARLRSALFGPTPSAHAQIAMGADGPVGLALFSPVFSTVRGGAGLFVSDLWVGGAARGQGLGRALLQSAAHRAEDLWDACFLRLAVYPDNMGAQAFYETLGFEPVPRELTMVLTGTAFQMLRGPR